MLSIAVKLWQIIISFETKTTKSMILKVFRSNLNTVINGCELEQISQFSKGDVEHTPS